MQTEGNSSVCPTYSFSDGEVEGLHEDLQSVMNKREAHYNGIMGDFSTEAGKESRLVCCTDLIGCSTHVMAYI